MAPAASSIELAEFQSGKHAYAIPAQAVNAYKDLNHYTYLAFTKPASEFDLHFHQDDASCDARISEALWDYGMYLNGLEGNRLKLYAHFTPKVEATPNLVSQTSETVHPSLHFTSDNLPDSEIVSSGIAQGPQHLSQVDALVASRQCGSERRIECPPQHYTVTREVARHEPLKREHDGGDVDLDSVSPIKFAKRTHTKTSKDAPTDTESACQSLCIHAPIRIVKEVAMLFQYVAKTEGVFKKWKDLTFKLPGEAGTDEILATITKDMKSVACTRKAPVRPYVRQVHFRAMLGSDSDHLKPLNRNLQVKEYGTDGLSFSRLCGRVEVYLEPKPGAPLKIMAHAVTDELMAAQRRRPEFTLQRTVSSESSARRPSHTSEEVRSSGPAFCSDTIHVSLQVTQELGLTAEQAVKFCKTIQGNVQGNLDGETLHHNVRERIKVRVERLKGLDVQELYTSCMVLLFLKPRNADKSLEIFSPFADPSTTVHQFLHPNAVDENDRVLEGKVVVKPKDKICKCGEYEGEISIICDGKRCKITYFHLRCVGLEDIPTSLLWYCPDCERKQDKVMQ